MSSKRQIPHTEDTLVLRTDFSDESAWVELCQLIQRPVGEFRAYVEFVSEPEYEGLTVERLLALLPPDYEPSFMFVIDATALSHPDHPVLVIDLYEARGSVFRVVPSIMWSVENNLSIANMDFHEFAESVDADGVFRGFV